MPPSNSSLCFDIGNHARFVPCFDKIEVHFISSLDFIQQLSIATAKNIFIAIQPMLVQSIPEILCYLEHNSH